MALRLYGTKHRPARPNPACDPTIPTPTQRIEMPELIAEPSATD